MDEGKKAPVKGLDDALAIAHKISSIRHTTVSVRLATDKEPKCDCVLDAIGIGRLYFVADNSEAAQNGLLGVVKVNKRSKS